MPRTTVNDIEIAYRDVGEGTPVLLVHGFPLDHSMWDAIVDQLARGCRLITPDLRGYGETPLGEVDLDRGVSMRQYAGDLAGLLEGMGVDEPIVYVGFSMGGYIGWQFVEHYGDRLCGLVMCDTRAAADAEEARQMRLKMASHVSEWGADRVADAMLPKLFAQQSLDAEAPIVERTRQVISKTDPRAIAAAQLGMASRPDVTSRLPSISLPTALIVGEKDGLSTPAEMQTMADAMPAAELTVVPNAGHMSPVENPQPVARAIHQLLQRIA